MPYPAKTSPEAILTAALEILKQSGPDALSTRNLADKLGIKAPSLYRHYPDRAALEDALVNATHQMINTELERVEQGLTPLETFHATAATYLSFVRTHPHLYDLMNAPQVTARRSNDGEGKRLWNSLLRVVGGISGNPDDTAGTVAFWSFLHGFISLERNGLFGPSGPKGGFEIGLSALASGFARLKNRP